MINGRMGRNSPAAGYYLPRSNHTEPNIWIVLHVENKSIRKSYRPTVSLAVLLALCASPFALRITAGPALLWMTSVNSVGLTPEAHTCLGPTPQGLLSAGPFPELGYIEPIPLKVRNAPIVEHRGELAGCAIGWIQWEN